METYSVKSNPIESLIPFWTAASSYIRRKRETCNGLATLVIAAPWSSRDEPRPILHSELTTALRMG